MEGRENGKEVYAVGPGTSEFPLETQDFLWEISSPQVTHNPLHEKFHKEFPKDSVPPTYGPEVDLEHEKSLIVNPGHKWTTAAGSFRTISRDPSTSCQGETCL